MNSSTPYNQYALCREMLQTPEVIRAFDSAAVEHVAPASDMILLTGEGSSRIFPARQTITRGLREGWPLQIVTEGACQSREYQLAGYHVYVASNSGRTAEGVALLRDLRTRGATTAPAATTGIVAHGETPIATEADSCVVLSCGGEDAVAATKSVVEQALVYDTVLSAAAGSPPPDLPLLADLFAAVVELPLPVDAASLSGPVYWAGRNDGVAEELALKTNEITRMPSLFLEGTYAVHGIEEVMNPRETVILVDPFADQIEAFDRVLRRGVGLTVVAIASHPTPFPTLIVPDGGALAPYLHLAAGWNLLVEMGLARGVDLDHPARARKVGNEVQDSTGPAGA